jgi:ethanolaminephosphotransferase
VEGILTLCIVYAITALKGGGSFWQQPMLATVGVPKQTWISESIYEMPFNEWYMLYGGVVLVFNTVQRSAQRKIKAQKKLSSS